MVVHYFFPFQSAADVGLFRSCNKAVVAGLLEMMVESVHMSLASVTELASRLGIASMEMKALGASFSIAAVFRRHAHNLPVCTDLREVSNKARIPPWRDEVTASRHVR
jgi:hypothetical protein